MVSNSGELIVGHLKVLNYFIIPTDINKVQWDRGALVSLLEIVRTS